MIALTPNGSRQSKVSYEDVRFQSRASFLSFVCCYDPSYQVSDFSYEVAENLEQFYLDSQNGLDPNLLLEAPPQHGKSYLLAILFPAWLLGINPNLRVVVATYSIELASDRCIAIQKIMSSPFYRYVFPATQMPTSRLRIQGKRDSFTFELLHHKGGLKTVGTGTGLTGFSMDIGIIDDPYKDMESARSRLINRKTLNWYHSVFATRSSKIGGTAMMLTRWTKNDIAGVLSARSDWKCLKYPAIVNNRPLVPALFSLQNLLTRKAKLPSFVWQAMYQQDPQIQGGNIVKESWIKYYRNYPTKFEKIFITGDTAFTAHESCDFSVFSVWGESSNNLYMLDMWRGQVDSPDLKAAALAIWDKWSAGLYNTPCRTFYVENKASGIGLIQDLKKTSRIPIKGVERQKDKYTRLQEVLTYIEAGRLHLNDSLKWTQKVIDELSYFSEDLKHEHDDIVDTIIDALNVTFVNKKVTMLDTIYSNNNNKRKTL